MMQADPHDPADGPDQDVLHHHGGGAAAATTTTTTNPNSTASSVLSFNTAGAPHRRKGHRPPANSNMANRLVDEVQKDQAVLMATVRRRQCGTGAFDQHWLNLDACGLFSAALTYGLHAYAIYAVCFVMLPPWMSYTTTLDGAQAGATGFAVGLEDTASSAGAQAAAAASLGSAATGTTVRHLTWAGTFHTTAFCTVALLAVVSHYLAMTTDPGAVPPDARPTPTTSTGGGGTGMRLCRRCKAYKPPRAHHCSVCKRCIIKMDHHCPWVNNCVGIGNHKYFLLFVIYTFLSCAYSMTLILVRFTSCVHMHHRRRHHTAAAAAAEAALLATAGNNATCLDQPTQLLTILGLIIEALLFGMFTSCMMCKWSSWTTTMWLLWTLYIGRRIVSSVHLVYATPNPIFWMFFGFSLYVELLRRGAQSHKQLTKWK